VRAGGLVRCELRLPSVARIVAAVANINVTLHWRAIRCQSVTKSGLVDPA
jgi:hypothetical protein